FPPLDCRTRSWTRWHAPRPTVMGVYPGWLGPLVRSGPHLVHDVQIVGLPAPVATTAAIAATPTAPASAPAIAAPAAAATSAAIGAARLWLRSKAIAAVHGAIPGGLEGQAGGLAA